VKSQWKKLNLMDHQAILVLGAPSSSAHIGGERAEVCAGVLTKASGDIDEDWSALRFRRAQFIKH